MFVVGGEFVVGFVEILFLFFEGFYLFGEGGVGDGELLI